MRMLIIGAATCAFASQAVAADLPSRAAPPVFVPPIEPVTWAGCYVGGFGAVDIAHNANTQTEARSATRSDFAQARVFTPGGGGVPNRTVVTNTTTITNARVQSNFPYGRTFVGGDGGGRLGCNYETGRIVIGGQIEGGYLGVDGTTVNPFRTTSISRVSGGPYGAISAKLGYAIAERTLLFVKGGVGYADLHYSTFDTRFGYFGTSHGSEAMPLVGAGLEYKITPQISLTGEYTYLRPGCRSVAYTVPTGGAGVDRSCIDKHMVALGLNYYFNPSLTPVVARY